RFLRLGLIVRRKLFGKPLQRLRRLGHPCFGMPRVVAFEGVQRLRGPFHGLSLLLPCRLILGWNRQVFGRSPQGFLLTANGLETLHPAWRGAFLRCLLVQRLAECFLKARQLTSGLTWFTGAITCLIQIPCQALQLLTAILLPAHSFAGVVFTQGFG